MKCSLKNILPIPSKELYQLNLVDKAESFVNRMRWEAFYCLNQKKCDTVINETFSFKSTKCSLPYPDLIPFKKYLSDIVEN